MAVKDLNLSLDQALFQPRRAEPRRASVSPVARGPETVEPGPTAVPETPRAPRAKQRRGQRPPVQASSATWGNRHWIAISCIALANMAFLVLAGIWLTGNVEPGRSLFAAINPAPAPQVSAQQQEWDRRLDAMEQKLATLQAPVPEQAVARAAPFDIEAHIRNNMVVEAGPAPPPAAAAQAPKITSWHINLGAFATRERAVAAQQDMRALGLQAKISQPVAGEQAHFLVLLEGFSDREAAELAANQIMTQTDLNGLWVGESE